MRPHTLRSARRDRHRGARLGHYVVINAKVGAQVLGLVWLGIGVVILVIFYATGRRPALGGLDASSSTEEVR